MAKTKIKSKVLLFALFITFINLPFLFFAIEHMSYNYIFSFIPFVVLSVYSFSITYFIIDKELDYRKKKKPLADKIKIYSITGIFSIIFIFSTIVYCMLENLNIWLAILLFLGDIVIVLGVIYLLISIIKIGKRSKVCFYLCLLLLDAALIHLFAFNLKILAPNENQSYLDFMNTVVSNDFILLIPVSVYIIPVIFSFFFKREYVTLKLTFYKLFLYGLKTFILYILSFILLVGLTDGAWFFYLLSPTFRSFIAYILFWIIMYQLVTKPIIREGFTISKNLTFLASSTLSFFIIFFIMLVYAGNDINVPKATIKGDKILYDEESESIKDPDFMIYKRNTSEFLDPNRYYHHSADIYIYRIIGKGKFGYLIGRFDESFIHIERENIGYRIYCNEDSSHTLFFK